MAICSGFQKPWSELEFQVSQVQINKASLYLNVFVTY